MHPVPSLRVLLVLAAACIPALARAQTVEGRVLEAGSNEPVGGAIVSVIGGTGERDAATLSDSSGTYRVRASGPGAYTLRVERVGFVSSTSEVVRLEAGQTVTVQLTANPRRVQRSTARASRSHPHRRVGASGVPLLDLSFFFSESLLSLSFRCGARNLYTSRRSRLGKPTIVSMIPMSVGMAIRPV